jgi:hypothetical protein
MHTEEKGVGQNFVGYVTTATVQSLQYDGERYLRTCTTAFVTTGGIGRCAATFATRFDSAKYLPHTLSSLTHTPSFLPSAHYEYLLKTHFLVSSFYRLFLLFVRCEQTL